MPPSTPPRALRRVGIQGILKPLFVERAGGSVTLTVTFSVGVDLPADRKGSDLSRHAEVLAEVVDRTANHPVPSLEAASSEIVRELLLRHPYAMESEVRAVAPYFLRKGISPERTSYEDYRLFAEATAVRGAGADPIRLTRWIGAEAVGMTACPCAMETAREALQAEFPALADPALAPMPVVTHNQRNVTRLAFELAPGVEVEADEMIASIESAQSSPTFAILKRGDEARAVIEAHRHPKFVEDVLRDLLALVPTRFAQLPDGAAVRVESRSEESIHKYDVFASHEATLAELRGSATG